MYLKVKKLNNNSRINPPAKKGDAGYDVFSTKLITLEPLERFKMPLGIALEFSEGYVCMVCEKSGLANKQGFISIGPVVDSSYRGEIHCIILNTSNKILYIEENTKIAQLVFTPCLTPEIEYVDELSESERGTDGFGSTGLK
jgi:dUTP pyrophosphatase